MKVICIDAKHLSGNYGFTLIEGHVYDVIDVVENDYGTFYLIYQNEDYKFHYHIRRFIPLSEIDEMELVNQKEQLA